MTLKDITNPVTQPDMVFYPENGEGRMEEVWHGNKMLHNIPDHLLSPTFKYNNKIHWENKTSKHEMNQRKIEPTSDN